MSPGDSVVAEDPVPIDVTTIDYWDAEIGIGLVGGNFVETWAGQKAAIAATAGNDPTVRPNYMIDPAFNNTHVVQSTQAGRWLGNPAIAPKLAAAGSRLYSLSLYRLPVAMPASKLWVVFCIGNVTTGVELHNTHYHSFGGSILRPNYNNNEAFVNATAPADTAVHVTEFWADGVNLNVRDNGVLYTAASAVALRDDATALGIGRGIYQGSISFSDCNHAFHMLCAGKPNDPYIAQLRAWLTRNKGAP